jgi:hypothetical protein
VLRVVAGHPGRRDPVVSGEHDGPCPGEVDGWEPSLRSAQPLGRRGQSAERGSMRTVLTGGLGGVAVGPLDQFGDATERTASRRHGPILPGRRPAISLTVVSWMWRLQRADGTLVPAMSPAHSSRSDAESWLGETWRDLADAGVAEVTLLEDGERVYGPMSLSDR